MHPSDSFYAQCGTFTGIGPEAESNHVTLRIKYGKIPKKTGISPDPAAESKVGVIHTSTTFVARKCGFLAARVAKHPSLAKRGRLAVARTPARRFCATRPCTLYLLRAVSCLVFFAHSARLCRFTLGWRWRAAQQRINLTQAVSR